MKKRCLNYLKLICSLLCAMMVFMPLPVLSEDDFDYTQLGGKHNGETIVDPISQEEGFSAVLYNNMNGLPTSEANDIVQSYEGFIWIGSYGGLIRYDGSRFERLDSSKGITSIKCLYVDTRNRLWAGTNENGVIMLENGNMTRWGFQDGLKSLSIRSILEGKDGRIYVATTEGLVTIDENMHMSYIEDLRLIDAFLHELRIGADGRIYAVSNPGDIYVIKDGKLEKQYRFSKSPFMGINCILPDPEDPDLVYVETQDGKVYHDRLDSGFENSEEIDISPLNQVQSFEYLYGDIWICARNGAGVLKDDGFHVLKNVPMNNSIGHVMTDYAGNLWFTSTREGVMKIVRNRFADIFERYDLSKRVVNSTCMYGDDLFIATDNGLLAVNKGGILEEVPLNGKVQIFDEEEETDNLLRLLKDCRIRSIIRDSKDRLWFSVWRKYGLLRYDHGDVKFFRREDGLASDAVRTIYECDDGRILVAANGGVSVIEGDEVTATYNESDGIVNTDILTVTQGEGKDIIIGTDGAGIYIIGENGTRHIDHRNGLTSEAVMRIKRDEKRKVYWIITGNSISYLDTDYELKTVDSFPYSNNFDLYENSKGEL